MAMNNCITLRPSFEVARVLSRPFLPAAPIREGEEYCDCHGGRA